MGNVIFINNYGKEYIISEEEAERQISQGKMSFKQIKKIKGEKVEMFEEENEELEEETKVETKVETKEIDLNTLSLEELQAEYIEVFGKKVAPAYKNNIEWIKNKLITK